MRLSTGFAAQRCFSVSRSCCISSRFLIHLPHFRIWLFPPRAVAAAGAAAVSALAVVGLGENDIRAFAVEVLAFDEGLKFCAARVRQGRRLPRVPVRN